MATLARRHRVCFRLAAALLLVPLAAAQWQFCGQTGNYSVNSTYQSNLAQLSATLPKNASAARTLFAKDNLGAVPDIVYALTLCRGDITNASACESCVANAFQDAQQLCPMDLRFSNLNFCYLRFSNLNFLTGASNGSPMDLVNTQSVSAPAEVFDAAVGKLLNATSDYAVVNSSRRFATGEEAFDRTDPTIYSLVQCTPDISPEDCRTCLGGIIPPSFGRIRGRRTIAMRCNYRYELNPFFSGGSMLRLPAPTAAPPPAPANMTPPAPTGGRYTGAPEIKVDNKFAIAMSKNPIFHDRTKHIDTRYHFIRECIEGGKILINYIHTEKQLADVLTKLLGHVRFQELCQEIGIVKLTSDGDKN